MCHSFSLKSQPTMARKNGIVLFAYRDKGGLLWKTTHKDRDHHYAANSRYVKNDHHQNGVQCPSLTALRSLVLLRWVKMWMTFTTRPKYDWGEALGTKSTSGSWRLRTCSVWASTTADRHLGAHVQGCTCKYLIFGDSDIFIIKFCLKNYMPKYTNAPSLTLWLTFSVIINIWYSASASRRAWWCGYLFYLQVPLVVACMPTAPIFLTRKGPQSSFLGPTRLIGCTPLT